MTRAQAAAAAVAIVLGMLAAFTYGTFVVAHARTAGQQSVTCTYGTVRSIAGAYCQSAMPNPYLDPNV
jgi:hypothetical protein